MEEKKTSLFKSFLGNLLFAGFCLSLAGFSAIICMRLKGETTGFTGYFIFFGFLITFFFLAAIAVILKQLSNSELDRTMRELAKRGGEPLDSILKSGTIITYEDGKPKEYRFSSKEEYDNIVRSYLSNRTAPEPGTKVSRDVFDWQIKKEKPLSQRTDEELQELREFAISNQDYEFAAKIRDEQSNRNKK